MVATLGEDDSSYATFKSGAKKDLKMTSMQESLLWQLNLKMSGKIHDVVMNGLHITEQARLVLWASSGKSSLNSTSHNQKRSRFNMSPDHINLFKADLDNFMQRVVNMDDKHFMSDFNQPFKHQRRHIWCGDLS